MFSKLSTNSSSARLTVRAPLCGSVITQSPLAVVEFRRSAMPPPTRRFIPLKSMVNESGSSGLSSATEPPLSGVQIQTLSWLSPCKESRSEEHTSELQSRGHLVCRLLLDKNKTEWR